MNLEEIRIQYFKTFFFFGIFRDFCLFQTYSERPLVVNFDHRLIEQFVDSQNLENAKIAKMEYQVVAIESDFFF